MNSNDIDTITPRAYGALPIDLGIFDVEVKESMHYLYMPVLLAYGRKSAVPPRLKVFEPILNAVWQDIYRTHCSDRLMRMYVYITVKHGYVGAGIPGNRPGYHSDGFLTSDINYIWCDCHPTIFNSTVFNLTPDDQISLQEMEAQAIPSNEFIYPEKTLLKLDQYVIHKVPQIKEGCMRTFLKVSVSTDKYDLEGNTHNYLLDYNWEMKPRKTERNIPQSNIK